VLAEIKDQIKGGSVTIGCGGFGAADLDQIHHVLVLQQLQDADLSQGRDGELREHT